MAQIDTAKTYSQGTSEEFLGKINWKERGLAMDTKLYPNAVRSCSFQVASCDYSSRMCMQGDPRWAALGIETVSHSPEVRRLVPVSFLGIRH